MFLFSVKLLLYIRQSSYNNYISLINKLGISTDAIVEIPFNLSEGIELNRLKKLDNVDCVDLDSEGILFFTPEQKKQEKYIVNTSTMAIWDLLDGHRTAQDIAQEIADVCEVDFEGIKNDICNQLATLQELGLVEEAQAKSHA